jgi:hypothetical protein
MALVESPWAVVARVEKGTGCVNVQAEAAVREVGAEGCGGCAFRVGLDDRPGVGLGGRCASANGQKNKQQTKVSRIVGDHSLGTKR